MEINELYELIRKDEVCLFIGAGFSAYAGFPLGGKLKDIIYDGLTEDEKKEVSANQNLSKVAQDFVTIKGGKSELNAILQREFQKTPLSTFNHDQLSRIAFFKTIVTTNYDTLIEDSYTMRAVVISKALDILVPKQERTRIFKIHGTIQDLSSIVLTDEDYSNLYNIQFNNPFWASVLSELASKHIIFLGYGYEDLNIWAIFQKILEHTNNTGKSRFFISPSITDLKKKFLQQRNIKYFELSAEAFLNGLEQNIKKHLKNDVDNKLVPLNAAMEIFENYNMKVDLEIASARNWIKSLEKQSGQTNYELNFTLAGKRAINKFKKFQEGKGDINLTFTPKELKNFCYSIEGFDFTRLSELATLTIGMLPNFSQKCTVRFIDEDFELEDIYYDVYGSGKGFKIKIEKFGFDITINVDVSKQPKTSFTVVVKEPERLDNVNSAIKIYKLANLIFSGKKFNLFSEKSANLLGTSINPIEKDTKKKTLKHYSNKLNCFNAIRKIERALNLNFQNIDTKEIQKKLHVISNIEKLIDFKGIYFDEGDGVVFTVKQFGKEAINRMKEYTIDGKGLLSWLQENENIVLFGEKLKLGMMQVLINEPYISEETEEFVRVKSRTKKFIYRYEVFGISEKQVDSKKIW